MTIHLVDITCSNFFIGFSNKIQTLEKIVKFYRCSSQYLYEMRVKL